MLINKHTALWTPTTLLVPYCPHHVPTYHTWMSDPLLLAATASERLSLEEEYEMQKSWREDADKLTFIICRPREEEGGGAQGVKGGWEDRGERMVGDVNLFLTEDDEEEDGGDGEGGGSIKVLGEVEIMIAVPSERGKGIGKQSVLLFLAYVMANKEAIVPSSEKKRVFTTFRVKIDGENSGSIGLFESLGFRKTSEKTNYFGEWELRVEATEEYRKKVEGWLGEWKSGEYFYPESEP